MFFVLSFQECPNGVVDEQSFKEIFVQFFPQGGTIFNSNSFFFLTFVKRWKIPPRPTWRRRTFLNDMNCILSNIDPLPVERPGLEFHFSRRVRASYVKNRKKRGKLINNCWFNQSLPKLNSFIYLTEIVSSKVSIFFKGISKYGKKTQM